MSTQIKQELEELDDEGFEEAVIQLTLYSLNDNERDTKKMLNSLHELDLDGMLYFHAAMIQLVVDEKFNRDYPIDGKVN